MIRARRSESIPRPRFSFAAPERAVAGALSSFETRRLLGFETRYELDGFLKAHNVLEHAYNIEDFERDCETLQE
jgi:hypothetical protein